MILCLLLPGYGDLSPSITASQMTLLAMLLIAFTLLPYQVSCHVDCVVALWL